MLRSAIKLWFRICGWSFVGNFPRGIRKCVIVIGPHTSLYDYLLIYANIKARGFNHKTLVPKDQIRFPYKHIIKAINGIAYDKGDTQAIEKINHDMKNSDDFRLAFFPELSIERNDDWDLSFYFLAKEQNLPIVLLALDYKRKWIKYHIPFKASLDQERDIHFIKRFFSTCHPKYPERGVFI